MIIYPAIDIRGGRCVRLTEGRFDKETVFADDPAEMAVKWAECGARYLHLVDLDGALAGESRNIEVIKRILAATTIPVQFGGGIRTMENISRLLEVGVSRVILGSAAVKNPDLIEEACKKYPYQIAVGIDVKNGDVAIEGWEKGSGMGAIELAKRMAASGVDKIIFTDTSRDGMLTGVNAEATAKLAEAAKVDVIASGGAASLGDIKKLLKYKGISGCIIGKAIYTGAIDLKTALRLAEEADNNAH